MEVVYVLLEKWATYVAQYNGMSGRLVKCRGLSGPVHVVLVGRHNETERNGFKLKTYEYEALWTLADGCGRLGEAPTGSAGIAFELRERTALNAQQALAWRARTVEECSRKHGQVFYMSQVSVGKDGKLREQITMSEATYDEIGQVVKMK